MHGGTFASDSVRAPIGCTHSKGDLHWNPRGE